MNVPYATTHEMNFLENLGTGKYSRRATSRLELLATYKKLMFGRRWDLVDFEKVLTSVEKMIRKERKK